MMKKSLLLVCASAMTLTGCMGGQPNAALIGAAGGALAGGVLGHQINHDNGRYVGAAVGALAGAAIGNYMDQQQRQLQQQMRGTGVNVNRVDQSTVKLNIPDSVLFAVNQSQLSPQAYATLSRIAQILQQYPNTAVHVYGFTDGSGSPQYNMQLSQQRAQNAANYLAQQGINPQRFVIRGYGEQFATSQNNPNERRVEILIRAIDQYNPQSAYAPIY